MNIVRRALATPGGKFLTFILIAFLIYELWITVSAPAKVDPAIESAVRNGRVDIAVELNFPPERFHILELQGYGRLVGASENTIKLRRVDQETVYELARIYWIKSIKPLER